MNIDVAIDRFLNFLLVAKGSSMNTVTSYAKDLQHFLNFSNISDTDELSRERVLNYLESMNAQRELSPATVRRRIASLRSFSKFLLRDGILVKGVFPKGVRSVRWMNIPKALTQSEVERIISAIDTRSYVGIRDRALIETLYASGIRVSECSQVRLSDVNLERGTIRVRGKGGKHRVVLIGGEAREWLKRYIENSRLKYLKNPKSSSRKARGDALFLGRKGPLSRVQIFRIVREYALKAGVANKVSPHVFRHSFATHLLENGADVRIVQELLGHSNISTVEQYTKITMKHLRSVYEKSHPHASLAISRR